MSKIPPITNPKVGRAKPALGNSTTGVGVVPASSTVVGVGVAFGPGVLVGPRVGVEVGPGVEVVVGVGVEVGPGQLQSVSLVQSRFRQ